MVALQAEGGRGEGMSISVAQRQVIRCGHQVAQMLRYSQSIGSERTSKNRRSIPEAASSIDVRKGARQCMAVRDRAALHHAPRRPPARPPPRRCRSSTEGLSGGLLQNTPLPTGCSELLRILYNTLLSVRIAPRVLRLRSRLRLLVVRDFPPRPDSTRSQYRSTKREPSSPAPVATGHTCGGRKEHGNCV